MALEDTAASALLDVYNQVENEFELCDFDPSPSGASIAEQLCNLDAYVTMLLVAISCTTQPCVDDACTQYATDRTACFTS